ncbi:MAG TPA: hypothetical protein VFZ23_16860 [Pyrinomonadaceae bacterium]
MKKKKPKSSDSPEQVSGDEALKRMKSFAERKEAFIAAIKKSKDRDLSTGQGTE